MDRERLKGHAAGLGVGLVLLCRYGYVGGDSNAFELLALAKSRLAPDLYAHDWYLRAARAADVRWAADGLLAALGGLVGLDGAAWLLFVTTCLLAGWGLHAIGRALFGPSPLPALAAALLADRLAVLPGANGFWYPAASSAGTAIALSLPGLHAALVGRPLAAGVWLGVATAFHVQVGAGLAVAALAATAARRDVGGLGRLGLAAAAIGGPPTAWLLARLWALRADQGAVVEVLFFRTPWHYLPLRPESMRGLVVLAAWLVIGAALGWSRRGEAAHRALAAAAAAVAGLCAVGALGTHVVLVPAIVKLQLFRLAPFLVVFGALYAGDAAARLLARLGAWPGRAVAAGLAAAAIGGAALALDATATLAGQPRRLPSARLVPVLADADPPGWRELHAWARARSPRDAVFLVPPQAGGFRLFAERAVVVDFKSVAFSDQAFLAWEARILDVTGVRSRPGADWRRDIGLLAVAYGDRPLAELRAVARRYGARYVVIPGPPKEPPLFSNGAGAIYGL